MRFCGHCGAPLPQRCRRCGFENPPANKFCGWCAAALDRPADAETGAAAPAPTGELKRVTVLFCDLVGSTGLTERLGAEAMHELIRWLIDTALAEVHRYEGTVPQFTGDGFMALFGAPVAREDHAQRGLLAALAIRDAVAGGADHRWPALGIRIGVHTGLVVFGSVGDGLRMDPTVIGDAANVAARLQAAADPGTILVSDETRRAAQGYARVETVGRLLLKGKGEPITAYRLLGLSDHRPAYGEAAARPFVGRTSELAALCALAQPVAEGRGRAVAILGEPGIGKSRLLAEFRDSLAGSPAWFAGRCQSYGATTPYQLCLSLLRHIAGIFPTDTQQTIAEKLRCALQRAGIDADEDHALLLHLLGIAAPGGAALPSPEVIKAKTFEALRRLVVESSRRRPVVLALEDLHWIDTISEEFIALLAAAIAGEKILLLATYRPDYLPLWIDKFDAGEILLTPLSPADSLTVVRSLPGRLDDAVAAAIVAKADGNPLFLEQLALHAGETNAAQTAGAVPDTIHDVVMARIDRLPEETRRLLQTAAVVHRVFSLRLLRRIWRGAEPPESHLRLLTRLEFIDELRGGERPTYVFRHALTQETAYASLLERTRRGLHAEIARALEELYRGRGDETAERLAFHFGRSDEAEKAVDYAILAAEKAQRRWANSEALAYFEDALRRLDAMPDSEANRLRRIDAVLKQAEVKYALGQYTEQLQALEMIRGLAEECGEPRRRAQWHYWVGFLHATSGGRPEVAIAYCQEAACIALASGLDEISAFTESCLAQVYMIAGRQYDAIAAGERALASFESRGNRWWAGRTLWHLTSIANYLGEWQKSLDYCRRGLDHGIALEDLRFKTVGWTRMGLAYIQQGDLERGLQCCEQALALDPLPRDAGLARVVRGYGKIRAGKIEDGIAELSQALAWFENSRMRWTHVIGMVWLVEGYLAKGDRTAARPLIDYILVTSRKTGYLQYEGRGCWLLGSCLAAEAPAAAEDYVETAMRIFEEIGARNDLARALITRSALRQAAGDTATARRMLTRADAIFSELGTLGERERIVAALAALNRQSSRAV